MFTWRNGAGEWFELQPPNYIVTSHRGLGKVPVTLQTQRSPLQHGTTFIDSRLDERDFTLNILIPGKTRKQKYEKRRELVRAFSPRLGIGRLIWAPPQLEKEYYIDAIAEEAPVMPSESGGPLHQPAVVHLLAPDPTFYSPDPEIIEHDTAENQRIYLNNAGDVETPLKIIIPGPCEDPTIINRSLGQAIYFAGLEVGTEEQIEIDTAFGKKSVLLIPEGADAKNALNRVEVGSNLFYLRPGSNRIDVKLKAGEPTITYEYHNRYAGV